MSKFLSLLPGILFCVSFVGGMVFVIINTIKKDKREILKVIAYFLAGLINYNGFPIGLVIILLVIGSNYDIELRFEKVVAALSGSFAVSAFNLFFTLLGLW